MTNPDKSTVITNEFPSPPWRLGGQHWGALFQTDRPVDAAVAKTIGGKNIFSKRLGVAVLRYTTGTLCYDELIVCMPIRIGIRPYIWIRDIWVSDERSLAGGTHIWNLPKQLATFAWTKQSVTITDTDGVIARLNLNRVTTHWPWGFAFVPIAGSLNRSWKTATARWRGRVSLCKPSIEIWSDRFPERLVTDRAIGFSSSRFLMTIPDAKFRS